MISRKLRAQIEREGKKKGYRVVGIGRGMGQDDKEHLHIVLDWVHAVPEDLPEVYVPGFRCKIGIHDWGAWSDPVHSLPGIILDKYKQIRSCLLCNIHQARDL